MLKIRTQLGRVLRYQSTLGAERVAGHFDDAAKDLAGPPSRAGRERGRDAVIKSSDAQRARRMLMARVDPETGAITGYFAD